MREIIRDEDRGKHRKSKQQNVHVDQRNKEGGNLFFEIALFREVRKIQIRLQFSVFVFHRQIRGKISEVTNVRVVNKFRFLLDVNARIRFGIHFPQNESFVKNFRPRTGVQISIGVVQIDIGEKYIREFFQ